MWTLFNPKAGFSAVVNDAKQGTQLRRGIVRDQLVSDQGREWLQTKL